MISGPWKVGELAKLTGLTVRALHHYDEIGLLTPSHHTDSGHRLYTRTDLERLQQIMALRQLGFSLEQVKDALLDPNFSPQKTISSLREQLRQRRIELEGFDQRLAEVERIMAKGEDVSTERLIQIVEGLSMYEKYLTREQLATIKERTECLDSEWVRKSTEKDWPELIAAIKLEVSKGTDPADPKVQVLAHRWQTLTEEFTGGDPAISSGLHKMYEQDAEAFAKDKVAAYGKEAVTDLAGCVRLIAKALNLHKNGSI